MTVTTADSLADLKLTLTWEKQGMIHKEIYFADEANLYRDFFPKSMDGKMLGKAVGDALSFTFSPGELIPDYSEKEIHNVYPYQCDMRRIPGNSTLPVIGRFYPKGILSGIAGIFSENVTPFRVLDSNDRRVVADFNHPLSGLPLTVDVEVLDIRPKRKERGGMCHDWIEQLVSGPGIQARPEDRPVDFFSGDAFARDDENPDPAFYTRTRLVSHIDETARRNLAELYGKKINGGKTVLDLMASWESHVPDDLIFDDFQGLGMNEDELAANKRFRSFKVHDLNSTPVVPWPDKTFDAVICSLSVEYLTRPFDVFKEVKRILKPGGTFIVTFSNRWFPTKSIRLWSGLHEFERVALVAEYFLASGFDRVESLSLRGYPRPYTDEYFPAMKLSDPLYMVQGYID